MATITISTKPTDEARATTIDLLTAALAHKASAQLACGALNRSDVSAYVSWQLGRFEKALAGQYVSRVEAEMVCAALTVAGIEATVQ